MSKSSLAFIGAGNMAGSIIGGLIAKNYPPDKITASDPVAEKLEKLKTDYGIQTTQNNADITAWADVILLAVKPQTMKGVARALRQSLPPNRRQKPMVISIAAGITIASLSQWLGDDVAIVRCMPNIPALVQTAASGLYANQHTSAAQRQIADEILSAVGVVAWLDKETQIDSVTAISGSGPAYFFLLMEAMIEAGIGQGLSVEAANKLTLQTALGAAVLAQGSGVSVAELRRQVTSPGGTTESAIQLLENAKMRATVADAMQACADRAAQIAAEIGD